MTITEAISWMKAFKKTYNGFPKGASEACDMAIHALEKQQENKNKLIKDEDLVLKISGSMGSEYSYCIVKNLSLSELVSITKLWDQAASPEDSLEECLEKYKAEVIPIYSCQEEGYPIDFFDVEFDVDTGITLFTELSEDRQEEMLDSKECYNKCISMSLF